MGHIGLDPAGAPCRCGRRGCWETLVGFDTVLAMYHDQGLPVLKYSGFERAVNLTLGLPVVESLLKATTIPLDCHLMIDDPGRWAPPYAEAGAYNVTFHAEATDDPVAVAKDIRAAGGKAGLAIKPGTAFEPYAEILKSFDTLLVMSVEPGFGGQSFIADVLDKARAARRLVDSGELRLLVEIDGGINADTIEQAAAAGVDCFVAGSAVYNAADPAEALRKLRAQAAAVPRP